MRDLVAAYMRSSRDVVRASNRIWAFCNTHGLPLPKRGRAGKMQRVRSLVEERLDDGNQKFLARELQAK